MQTQSDQTLSAGLFNYVALLLYKTICLLMRLVDVRIVAVLGRAAGYLVWACAGRRRLIVARNLRIVADPMLRSDKLAPMIRRNIVRTVMNLACSIKTGVMTPKEMQRFIRIEGGELFEKCGSNGHTVVSCIPHAGNWEALARIRPVFHRVPRFASMYRRLSNPLLEEFIYKSRTRYGCEMYSKEDGLREVLKLARSGGLLGVLSDQFTTEGLYLPYFGKVTGVTPLPAIIYKRCKGKGHLFSVFTRNTALGCWDTVLGREIHLPEGCESLAAITMQVNLALENCQNENILDGFWMHHRWKTTRLIAPQIDEDTRAEILEHARLPFRMVVVSPDSLQEAQELLPAVRALAACRPDAQVSVICNGEQASFWREQDCVRHVVLSDGAVSVAERLDQDDIYKDGPFDVLFMFGGNRALWRQLKSIFPVYVIGWEDHPLAGRFRLRYERSNNKGSLHTRAEYASNMQSHHGMKLS